jgi:hypothetical protein
MAGQTFGVRRVGVAAVAVTVLLGAVTAVVPSRVAAADRTASATFDPAVMRPSRVSSGQLADWYRARTPAPYRARARLPVLAQIFIEEGRDEGVAGDLAFVQSIVETGWFGFSGRVPAWANNFSGLGATDGTQDYATFPTPRIGVRAQIQHLRAYADPGVTEAKLAHPLVDPRFDLVKPKGKARTWGQMGNGNWASDPDYARKILMLYRDLLRFSRTSSFTDVPTNSYYATAVAWMEHSGITTGVGSTGRYYPDSPVNRAELAAFLWRTMGKPRNAPHHGFPDVPSGSYYDIAVRYLKAAGVTGGVGDSGRYQPALVVSRGQMVTFLWRLAGSPSVPQRHRFPDVRADAYYDRAVSWAVRHRITDGVGTTGRFEPDWPVTRGQMAAFLYRLVLRASAWDTPLPPTAP